MQKAILKLYVKGKRLPLFACKMYNEDIGKLIKDLDIQLNDKQSDIVSFGQMCFARKDFRYYSVKYL